MLLSVLVYCLVQILLITSVEGVSMSVTPSSMVIGSSSVNPVTRLELRCSSEGTSISTLYSLEILRRRFTEVEYTSLVTLDSKGVIPTMPQDIASKSPNVTGSLDGTSGSLILTMDGGNILCGDQAEFKCEINYRFSSSQIAHESKNFTVITAPNDFRITEALYEDKGIQLQLTNDSRLNVGTRITYKCSANIGSDSNLKIVWERSSMLGASTVFTTYTPAVPTDIVQEDPVVQGGCYYTRMSTMYYNMTSMDDDGITFRCKVGVNVGNQWYEPTSMHRRTFTIRTSANGGGNASGLSGSTSEAGVIAGAVIGAIAGVVLLIVLVYFLWYRRRSNGESYRTKEEGERPEPPPTDYTYSMPDKKKTDGYDNKGLDEPHEKTTRYPRSGRGGFDGREGRNDRGHHNPGMDDEDGGTMHMSSGPIGTGV